jgi:2-polyprenyl-3-methyl-5-hydroxy-6-metoxy-1,4-benzoquinol methylase
MPIHDHRHANLENWNDRVAIHTAPDGYEIDQLVDDPDATSNEVAFDHQYLGDVTGQSLIHLRCHIGTDSVSWARLGARVTGLDFSPPALAFARDLATRMGVDARFLETELYDARSVLDEEFDIVYASVGTIT